MSIKNEDNIDFFIGNESKYVVAKHGTGLYFANDTKQLLLDGLKYIPKKLSELTNDMGYITSSSTIKPSQVKTVAGDYTQGKVDLVTSRACNNTRVNMLFGFDAPYIDIEYSKDGGATWLDYGLSDYQKTTYFVQERMNLLLGKATTPAVNAEQGTNSQLRVTLTGERYCTINQFVIELSTMNNKPVCDIEICKSGQEEWTTLCSNIELLGWSGYNSIHTASTYFATNDKLRFTFKQTAVNTNSHSAVIFRIMGYGESMYEWSKLRPFAQRMVKHDHAYSLDGDGVAIFGQQIQIQAQSGFAPLWVNSTLLCPDLNADLLDGKHLSEIKTDILSSNGLSITEQYHYAKLGVATKLSDIIPSYTDRGSVLTALRDISSDSSFLLGNYSSGVLFGGGDTFGAITQGFLTPLIRFAGGNKGNFNWWLGIRGSNKKEYNLNSFLVDGGNASVNSLSVLTDTTIDGALNVIGGTSADVNGGYAIIADQSVKINGGLHGCSHIKNSTDTGVKITYTDTAPTSLSELYKAVGFSRSDWYTLFGVGMWVTGDGNGHIQVGRFDKKATSYNLYLQEWGEGKVGIGTASPTAKLTVNGTTALLSSLSVTGATTLQSTLTVNNSAQVQRIDVINNSLQLRLMALSDANYIVSSNASYNTPKNLVICADDVKAIPLVKMYATTFEVTGAIKIGDVTLSWDSSNKMLKIDKSVYSMEAISAKGVSVTTYTSYDCVAQFGMYYNDVWTMQRTTDRNITVFGASTLPAQLDNQYPTNGGELKITASLFNGCALCDIDVEYARFEYEKDDMGYDGHDVMTLIPTDITNNTLTCRVYWDTDTYGSTPPYYCGFRFRVYKNVQHNE